MGCCLEGVVNNNKKSRVQLQYKKEQESNNSIQNKNNSRVHNENNCPKQGEEQQQQQDEFSISRRKSKSQSVIGMQMKEQSIAFKEKGNIFFKQNDYLEAIRQYTQAISLYPDSVYYSNRAQCYRQLSNWTEVLKDACESIRLDYDNYKAYNLKGMAQVMQSKEMSISSDQWELVNTQGIKSMQKALDMINSSEKKQDFQLISTIQQNISKAKQILNLKKAEKNKYKKNQVKQLTQKLLENDSSGEHSLQEIQELIERKTKLNDNKPPDAFLYFIKFKQQIELMVNPVITSSGLSYEQSLLEDHIKANGEVDPTTRVKIDPKKYIQNTNLRQAIQDYKSKNIDTESTNNYNQIVF